MFLILHIFLFFDDSNLEMSSLLNSYHNINNLSLPIPILSFLFLLNFLPALILMATSFTRIIIVLGLLRNALGMPFSPPNQILLGMSYFLTFFVMHPTFERIYKEAYIPYYVNNIQIDKLIQYSLIPIHDFMIHQTRESDLFLFYNLSHTNFLHSNHDIPFRILLPAFVTSELKTAFQIGFTIMIPFLIIDLLVASVLIALGMMMIPPSTIALPCKLILFVLVDGWNLLFSSLVKSFY